MCQAFSHFFRIFASFCMAKICHHQHKGNYFLPFHHLFASFPECVVCEGEALSADLVWVYECLGVGFR